MLAHQLRGCQTESSGSETELGSRARQQNAPVCSCEGYHRYRSASVPKHANRTRHLPPRNERHTRLCQELHGLRGNDLRRVHNAQRWWVECDFFDAQSQESLASSNLNFRQRGGFSCIGTECLAARLSGMHNPAPHDTPVVVTCDGQSLEHRLFRSQYSRRRLLYVLSHGRINSRPSPRKMSV